MAIRACAMLAAACLCSAVLAEPVECVTATGQTWRGETGATIRVVYVASGRERVVEGELISATARYMKVRIDGRGDDLIFLVEVQRIETIGDTSDGGEAGVADTEIEMAEEIGHSAVVKPPEPTVVGGLPRGVLVLPLIGGVGEGIRATEIEQIGKHADKYGPGQIIVLDIESPGGSVRTWEGMRTVMRDLTKRHRVVAWVGQAISGGAATALLCQEIYFKNTARLGAITVHSGGAEASPQVMAMWVWELEKLAAHSGRSPLFAGPMTVNHRAISYDVDERTGEITYYDDPTRGKHSPTGGNVGENLVLTAEDALHCGFSDGTADNVDQLATLLDLGEWVELDDYGRDLHDAWHKTLKDFDKVGMDLFDEFRGNVNAPTPQARIGKQIRAGESLLAWAKKLGESAEQKTRGALGEEGLERIRRGILELRHQLSLLDR